MTKESAIFTLQNFLRQMRVMGRKGNGNPQLERALIAGIDALRQQPDFQKLGRKGGLATKATHKPDYFRRIGKLGGRRKKKEA